MLDSIGFESLMFDGSCFQVSYEVKLIVSSTAGPESCTLWGALVKGTIVF